MRFQIDYDPDAVDHLRGFPTRVRLLFHEFPKANQGGWPPERGVVDRDIDIAISQFAPGAQTVKDDELHTAVGIVDFRAVGVWYEDFSEVSDEDVRRLLAQGRGIVVFAHGSGSSGRWTGWSP